MYYFIITLGCQMNKSDSERIAGVLVEMGLTEATKAEEADVIVINTCSVRQAAEDRASGFTRNFANWKKNKPDLIVCVTGCLPGRDQDGQLQSRLHAVDLFFPIIELPLLPSRLAGLNPVFQSNGDSECGYLNITPVRSSDRQMFLPIQTGCNEFCSYCVVPQSRGREANRPLKDILQEAQNFVTAGGLEITLLGQVVNHYQTPDPENFSSNNIYQKNDFAKLLWELNQIEGLARIHFTGPHPRYMDDEQISALTLSKQVNFLHLPVQSGSNAILKRMNRKYDREFYLDIINLVRAKKPEIAIGTDIIVGFCGETEEDFVDTLNLYQECDFDIGYLAKYSARSGTLAYKTFADDVTAEEKDSRWERLQKLMKEIVLKKNQKYVGQVVSVLVEKYQAGNCFGNSNEFKLTTFPGLSEMVGTIQEVKIIEAGEWMLTGKQMKTGS